MTPEERKSLAQQITTNPLFTLALDEMEQAATERLIYEKDNMVEAQLRVQAIRSFRRDLGKYLNTPTKKGAPA